jgi:hydrogenase small subunit
MAGGYGGNGRATGLESLAPNRREFLKIITIAAASVGLPVSAVGRMAEAATAARKGKPSVVWLHFQECTGCTESLLRTSHPALSSLILDLVSLDYHETLFAAAGRQAEDALAAAVRDNDGRFILVVEGAIPVKDGGVYCKVGGKTALQILNEVAPRAGAIVAIGSCASFGGIPAAEPNPTGATGVPQILKGKPVVTLPGCPANPYNLLGTVLQFATYGTLPALDELGRPKFAYARVIHEDCPRRPHFDAGRFAERFGEGAHRDGQCLYKLGCKGPVTHANCSLLPFNEMPGAWPVGIGHPCVGCTEQAVAFRIPMFDVVPIHNATPPSTYAQVSAGEGKISIPAALAVGGALGALAGASIVASKKFSERVGDQDVPGDRRRWDDDKTKGDSGEPR